MPVPLYGIDKEGDAVPIRANKRGRVMTLDSGLLWVLVGLNVAQAAALIALVVMSA